MYRYGMTTENTCERCGLVEMSEHLLWVCVESRNVLDLYNEFVSGHLHSFRQVEEYKDIFCVDDNAQVCKAKIKIVQKND